MEKSHVKIFSGTISGEEVIVVEFIISLVCLLKMIHIRIGTPEH